MDDERDQSSLPVPWSRGSNCFDIIHPDAHRIRKIAPLPIGNFETAHDGCRTFIWPTMVLRAVDQKISK